MQNKDNISPDGKWQITIDKNGKVTWFDLTGIQDQYTIKDVVDATKNIAPEIWKNK